MRFLFFLGHLCEGALPAGGGGENLFPGDYDYIRQGRGHNVCLAVSRDGEHIDSKQCLLYNKDYPAGLTCSTRPGRWTPACLPTPLPCIFAASRSSKARCARRTGPPLPLRGMPVPSPATPMPPAWGCKTLPVQNIFAWNVHFLPNVTF